MTSMTRVTTSGCWWRWYLSNQSVIDYLLMSFFRT